MGDGPRGSLANAGLGGELNLRVGPDGLAVDVLPIRRALRLLWSVVNTYNQENKYKSDVPAN